MNTIVNIRIRTLIYSSLVIMSSFSISSDHSKNFTELLEIFYATEEETINKLLSHTMPMFITIGFVEGRKQSAHSDSIDSRIFIGTFLINTRLQRD